MIQAVEFKFTACPHASASAHFDAGQAAAVRRLHRNAGILPQGAPALASANSRDSGGADTGYMHMARMHRRPGCATMWV